MTREELDKRNQRSQNLRAYQLNDHEYFVESSQGKISYKVIIDNGHTSCTCGDYASKVQNDPQFQCKHILAVINGNGNIQHETMKQKPKLDDRWITSIKGKDFVVYSGLLDLAHQIGIQSIQVEVVQYPAKENGNEAICRAITHSKDDQLFEDFGDANPKNTNTLVVNHLLRVASTRAKARTLRDMTNIGMTCLEELGDDEDIDPAATAAKNRTSQAKKDTKNKQQATAKPQSSQNRKKEQPSEQPRPDSTEEKKQSEVNNGGNTSAKPSSAQVSAIKNLAYRKGLSDADLDRLAKEKLNIPSFSELSADHAGRFIKILQQSA